MATIEKSTPADAKPSVFARAWSGIKNVELTFYRVHLTAFTFIPLIASGIFYASNGRFQISYVDSLFLCYSAMTVTGLATINLSTTTAWQQVILYILMILGDITTVSWVMVLVRKRYFRKHFENLPVTKIFPTRETLLKSISSPIAAFRPRDIIPMDGKYANERSMGTPPGVDVESATPMGTLRMEKEKAAADIAMSDLNTFTSSPAAATINLSPVQSRASGAEHRGVAFDLSHSMTPSMRRRGTLPIPRSATILSSRTLADGAPGSRPAGPLQSAKKAFRSAAPGLYKKLERKLTMPSAVVLKAEATSWLDFDLDIGRNSYFHTETLSDDQLEALGGAEYRALRLLSYLVPMYFVLTQMITFTIFAPWLSTTHKYDDTFESQPRLVNKAWYSVFQTMSAYTGGGLSLVDAGMVPFQRAYLMIFPLIFVMLAGNHALPIFLRLIIWIGSKLAQNNRSFYPVFEFLLHHPRRCFFYLFPSHQTWFLVVALVSLSIVEWVAFDILNIGLAQYDALRTGDKIVVAIFQGLSARASGFSIYGLADAAPALQFVYIVMMYIAVYPVAMSIRSTNVNEEPALGIYEAPEEDLEEEPALDELEKFEPRQRVGKYLGWHLRKQMSIDLWWLVCAIFLITIIERHNLMDQSKKWFDLFRVLFELVSAFGGIGLSLGLPDANYSFSGSFKTLSKLVVIIIMVRGRHRGLPVSIDRAVNVPIDLVNQSPLERNRKARQEALELHQQVLREQDEERAMHEYGMAAMRPRTSHESLVDGLDAASRDSVDGNGRVSTRTVRESPSGAPPGALFSS
ncbi:TrkH-domain-containing protein [Cylindrobasidium torrendii FP15055 ss-10]|uniref:TrkH-domain-containing protein n=1 Tax=Cylindrobasidium torrendii FP15055 ss-10 TaxID=1314674 RepID=A0A0D7BBR1_9AGAR|nr:TrkH-domain-containing protein [Cylindrobasidium torrendii FP15055 ss-10]